MDRLGRTNNGGAAVFGLLATAVVAISAIAVARRKTGAAPATAAAAASAAAGADDVDQYAPDVVVTATGQGLEEESAGLDVDERELPARSEVIGLLNLGNTCYMNSVLQALAATPKMLEWLNTTIDIMKRWPKDPQHAKQLASSVATARGSTGNPESEVATQLRSTLTVLSSLHTPENADRSYRPNLLHMFGEYFQGNQQEDAQEFLHLLMHVLDDRVVQRLWASEALARPLVDTATPGLDELERDTTKGAADSDGDSSSVASFDPMRGMVSTAALEDLKPADAWARGRSCNSDAAYHNPLEGWLGSHLKCMNTSCSQPVTGIRTETFLSLNLPIKNSRGTANSTIQQCLNTYKDGEYIGDYSCEACHQKGVTRHQRILRLPYVLCLHVQRRGHDMMGGMVKYIDKVTFPEVLDMGRYVSVQGQVSIQAHSSGGRNAGAATTEAGGGSSSGGGSGGGGAGGGAGAGSGGATTRSVPLELYRQQSINTHGKGAHYVLMAVVEHLGGAYSGHYRTFRRCPAAGDSSRGSTLAGRWVVTSDRMVAAVDVEDVMNAEAFLLFYERADVAGVSTGQRGEFSYALDDETWRQIKVLRKRVEEDEASWRL